MKEKEIDLMMDEIDRKCKLPKHWNEFIDQKTKNDYYIVKDTKNKTGYCTSCGKTFFDKKLKIGNYFNCPNCNNIFYVLNPNRYIKDFTRSVLLLQRINKQIVIRVFEICSFYNINTKKMDRDIQEYCRIIPGKGKFLSDAVSFYLFGMHIYHFNNNTKWRKYDGCRYFSDYDAYPYNKKRLIKGTNMEYAPIDDFTNRFFKYNFIDALEFAAYDSFELLWNMKLYELCFVPEKFNKKGSFYKRFGISKDYLKFMQDNNLNYSEFRILKLIKEKDMNLIKKLSMYNYNYVKFLFDNQILNSYFKYNHGIYDYNIKYLKKLQEYIPLRKLNQYEKGLKNLNIYIDYFEIAQKLGINYKSKKDLFPRNLISRHDKMQKKIEIEEDMNTQFKAYIRFLELSKYTFEDEKYIIFPAPSIDDLIDEGRQQHNCVGHLYLIPYISNQTEIYFIREKDNISKSFITLEFKNGKVIQKELTNHQTNFKQEQNDFIDKWLNYRIFVDKKIQFNKKYKVIKYNLRNKVA